eukprot:1151681-Pelagomonas_calceolata.AAC.1
MQPSVLPPSEDVQQWRNCNSYNLVHVGALLGCTGKADRPKFPIWRTACPWARQCAALEQLEVSGVVSMCQYGKSGIEGGVKETLLVLSLVLCTWDAACTIIRQAITLITRAYYLMQIRALAMPSGTYLAPELE